MFKSIIVDQDYTISLGQRDFNELPEGDILIKVHYSSLNYKDALSCTGYKGITKHYPHTPGIDAAGIVIKSNTDDFQKDTPVIVTGFDLGMNTFGGFSEYIQVAKEWVIALPQGLDLKHSMQLGTAGLTAGLSVYKLQKAGITKGNIIVTGATGGVGSITVALLHKLGYQVTAVTGKTNAYDYLTQLGASEIISRETLENTPDKPLLKAIYQGAIDTVGGDILTHVLKQIAYDGVVTCCGMVNKADFHSSIYPFILRGVSLLGVDSVQCDINLRKYIWQQFGQAWQLDLDTITTMISLSELAESVTKILNSTALGRIIIKI